jgi:small subunit ribosomal protein S24e
VHPTRANVPRAELADKLASLYKTEAKRVVVFGLKTKFGGGSSQGFGLIYDDEESQKKFEPKYRLVRVSWAFERMERARMGPGWGSGLGVACTRAGEMARRLVGRGMRGEIRRRRVTRGP